MAQTTILTMFLFCLLANLGLWLAGGWMVINGMRGMGSLLFFGAIAHGWLMWESFVFEFEDESSTGVEP